MQTQVVVIGAGPAGLTAAYLLAKQNIPVTVLEADPAQVGGIAKTLNYKDYLFDIGGQCLFTQSSEILALWNEILPNDLVECQRSSRILYRGKFFSYPLKLVETLQKFGLVESLLCTMSYLKTRLSPNKALVNFSDSVTKRFGKRLFNQFYKPYAEKVWGMHSEQISAEWADRQTKDLSPMATFSYPRKGPGMLWDTCVEKIKALGGKILMGCEVFRCEFQPGSNEWTIFYHDHQGETQTVTAKQLISTALLRDFVLKYLHPFSSPPVLEAASQLQYRDFLTVALIIKDRDQITDNWLYVHDASVSVARIQNFKSWSSSMVPDKTTCCYGMEYFCFKGDTLWSLPDNLLIQKAKDELVKLGLANDEDILDGCVVRQARAYPLYDNQHHAHVDIIRCELEEKFSSLHLIGHHGMHQYANLDQAMMTAMLAVKNIIAGELNKINTSGIKTALQEMPVT